MAEQAGDRQYHTHHKLPCSGCNSNKPWAESPTHTLGTVTNCVASTYKREVTLPLSGTCRALSGLPCPVLVFSLSLSFWNESMERWPRWPGSWRTWCVRSGWELSVQKLRKKVKKKLCGWIKLFNGTIPRRWSPDFSQRWMVLAHPVFPKLEHG